jgi:hypothetical protein
MIATSPRQLIPPPLMLPYAFHYFSAARMSMKRAAARHYYHSSPTSLSTISRRIAHLLPAFFGFIFRHYGDDTLSFLRLSRFLRFRA